MLVDAATLYFRAFHALPTSLTDPEGRPNNAVRGFLDGLRVLRDAHRPDRIIACWDEDWRPQWRVDLVPTYKAHRIAEGTDDGDETPAELAPQIPVIAEVLQALGIPVVGAPAMEADDVVAALAFSAHEPVDIVSGDRDLVQLVADSAQRRLLYLGTGVGKHTVFDEAAVEAAYGVRPDRYADLAVLRGDPSDGLPGAAGIGAKTAARYLAAFGDLEGVLTAAHTVAPPLTTAKAAVLRDSADALRAALRVVRLQPGAVNVPEVTVDPDGLARLGVEFGIGAALRRWAA